MEKIKFYLIDYPINFIKDTYHKCRMGMLDWFRKKIYNYEINEVLNSMPSVQPKEKTGRWLHHKGKYVNRWICTECNYKWFYCSKYTKQCRAQECQAVESFIYCNQSSTQRNA